MPTKNEPKGLCIKSLTTGEIIPVTEIGEVTCEPLEEMYELAAKDFSVSLEVDGGLEYLRKKTEPLNELRQRLELAIAIYAEEMRMMERRTDE